MATARGMTFRRKLFLFATLTSGIGLVIAAAATLIAEWRQLHEETLSQLTVQTDIVAVNLSAALSFDDSTDAANTLASFRADSRVLDALACKTDESLFSTYIPPGATPPSTQCGLPPGHSISNRRLTLVRTIRWKDEAIGTVIVHYSLDFVYTQMFWQIVITALVLGTALIAAQLVASPIRSALLRPVTDLARAAHAISETGNYDTRVVKHADDELGHLADAFNLMVSQVQSRDAAIRRARDELEQRVRERTAELAAQKDWLDAILRDIDAIVWEADPKMLHFSFVSERAVDILGYPISQWINEKDFWLNVVHPEDREQAFANCVLDTERREDHSFMYRAIAADGRVVWLQDVVRVICDEQGPAILRGVMIDFTVRKALEESLESARLVAEAANRSKSEFLANMSHEIRTPMTAILGFSEQLAAKNLSPVERDDAIETIHRNGEHLLAIINDILDLSKMDAGKFEIHRAPCDVSAILADVSSLLRVHAIEKGLALDIQYDGPIPETIETDALRLRQILLNLVGNAIKFTRTGGVTIQVRCTNTDQGDQFLRFAVIDTGIGIPPEVLPTLFKPFIQADTTVTRRFGGTGLGLSIAKRLAEMLGGDIDVESTPGQGCTFRFSVTCGNMHGVRMLTQPVEAAKKDPRGHLLPSNDSPAASQALRCRVLFAEDGPDNQRLIAHVLRKAGAEVQVVENGESAVKAAMDAQTASRPFDVILMDMQMPVMDGYTATRRLRELGYCGPIIALTAHAMAEDSEKCLNAGCTDYATKPIDRKLLLETIQRHLVLHKSGLERTPQLQPLTSELTKDPDLAELVNGFLETLPPRVAAMERALRERDQSALRELAHQLKGSAGGFGYPAISEAATQLEHVVASRGEFVAQQFAVQGLAELCRRACVRSESSTTNGSFDS